MKFAILLEKCGTAEAFQKVVPEHIAYLQHLHDTGVLIAAGPFGDGQGGLILIEAKDEAAAQAVVDAEPFVVQQVERYRLRSWEVLAPVRPELLTQDD